MVPSTQSRAQSLTLTLPAEIVREAALLFPSLDLGVLSLTLLEKYVRFHKRRILAQQYQSYYESLSNEDLAEEKEMMADFAAIEGEVNAFIEAEEANGSI